MNKVLAVVLRVVRLEIPERHIPDYDIIRLFKLCTLKPLVLNIGTGIEVVRYSYCQGVDFHAVKGAVIPHFFWHIAVEVTRSH